MIVSRQKSNQLKSIAILMMLCLHLFNRNYSGLFQPLIFMGNQPLSYYISIFSDACVPIFAFISGYGLYFSYINNPKGYYKKNIGRIKQLYLRYWIIILLFVVLLGWFVTEPGYPGDLRKFILNLTGLRPSYNGAWWFFTIYILFVFTSKFWFWLIDRLPPYFYLSALLVVYFIAFYFRIYKIKIFENLILDWLHSQGALYFYTLFQFMLGAFALKYQWYSKVSNVFKKHRFTNLLCFIGILGLIILHGLIPNFIIAPITALGFIFLFLQIQLGKFFEKGLSFFTPHSTNLWLIHMFFLYGLF